MVHPVGDHPGLDRLGCGLQAADEGVGFGEKLARELDLATCDAAGIERLEPRRRREQNDEAASRQTARDGSPGPSASSGTRMAAAAPPASQLSPDRPAIQLYPRTARKASVRLFVPSKTRPPVSVASLSS